jgi:hypothetical protein
VWSANDISLEIIEADHPVVLIRIRTPVGELEIVGNVTLEETTRTLGRSAVAKRKGRRDRS